MRTLVRALVLVAATSVFLGSCAPSERAEPDSRQRAPVPDSRQRAPVPESQQRGPEPESRQRGPEPESRRRAPVPARGETAAHIPENVVTVYEQVLRTGHAPPGYVGGRVFENRERRLPSGGNYHEFDVNPKVSGRNRGAERLIVEIDTGEGWYTADHYRTFVPIERSTRER